MHAGSTLSSLLEIAAGQHGFITPDSARTVGVDAARLPVLLARGQLERWGRGVYRIPLIPIGQYDFLAAAVMRVGHGAVVSHESALYLHGLSNIMPATIDITVPSTSRVRRAGLEGITVWRKETAPDNLATVDGIPTTTIVRTLLDCRGVNIEHTEEVRVEFAEGKALYDGRSLFSWASRVADRIVERCGASRVILYGSVARGDDGPDSDLDLLVVMPVVGRRHDTSVRVLNELRDLRVPIDITVVDPAHLDEEAQLPGVVRVAMREGRVLVSV